LKRLQSSAAAFKEFLILFVFFTCRVPEKLFEEGAATAGGDAVAVVDSAGSD
jgi:hypothetical protein